MIRSITIRLTSFIQRLEVVLPEIFGRGFPPESFAIATINHPSNDFRFKLSSPQYSLKDLIGDGILWAVPKHRRTVERRLKRKFDNPKYPFSFKLIRPKTNLQVCQTCGHDHEVGVLCPNCYEKIRKETEEMQAKIQEKLGLEPIEQDVIVLYEGEKAEQPTELFNGKRIVEMEKPRPMWFSKNLLQKSTQPLATTKEVKPDDLG